MVKGKAWLGIKDPPAGEGHHGVVPGHAPVFRAGNAEKPPQSCYPLTQCVMKLC